MTNQDFEARAEHFVRTRFGDAAFESRQERVMRILEEAIELAQAEDVLVNNIHRLVFTVYERPKGHYMQELAGVAFTLYAYAACIKATVRYTLNQEIKRCFDLPIEHFQKRHDEKIALGVSEPKEPHHG